MRVRATVSLHNAVAVECRHRLGLSQTQVAECMQVTQHHMSELERLIFKRWSDTQIDSLAALYGCQPEELVPAELRGQILKSKFAAERDMPAVQLLSMRDERKLIAHAEAPMLEPEAKALLDKALDSLSFLEREVVKLRYGVGDGDTYTLEEVGRIFRVNKERVRQIEARAVRKLQNPQRTARLKVALGVDE